jgi:uncharacterized membrane protein YfcA
MPDPLTWMILIGTALLGSTIGGVAGFGAGILLLPVAAWTLGIRAAVPVLTVTMLLGNLARIWWSRHDLHGGVTLRFIAGAVPATAIGVMILAGASSDWLGRAIGAFLLASVPLRRVLTSGRLHVRAAHFPLIGGVVGLLSALVVTTGPVVTPFFLAYGLRRGAFIATEAMCAGAMHVTRGLVFARYRMISGEILIIGLVLGATMFAGAWLGRRMLDRMSDRAFLAVIEVLLVGMGLQMLLVPR